MASTVQRSREVTDVVEAVEQFEGVGMLVRRSIGGGAKLKNLSPFLMLDHASTNGGGAPDHPHRGQVTLSYMIQGRMRHEDFTGTSGLLESGDVQWMVAGRGIMHSEVPLKEDEHSSATGLQLWIDLPKANKMCEPRYKDVRSAEMPVLRPEEGVEVKIISGESYGVKGPDAPQELAGCWYFDFKLSAGATYAQVLPKGWTAFLYILDGAVHVGDDKAEAFNKHHLVVLSAVEAQDGVTVRAAEEAARGVLIAGAPLDQDIVQYGPFVTTTMEEARQAVWDYRMSQNGFERARGWQSEGGTEFMHRR